MAPQAPREHFFNTLVLAPHGTEGRISAFTLPKSRLWRTANIGALPESVAAPLSRKITMGGSLSAKHGRAK
jgi:hypothetical protein